MTLWSFKFKIILPRNREQYQISLPASLSSSSVPQTIAMNRPWSSSNHRTNNNNNKKKKKTKFDPKANPHNQLQDFSGNHFKPTTINRNCSKATYSSSSSSVKTQRGCLRLFHRQTPHSCSKALPYIHLDNPKSVSIERLLENPEKPSASKPNHAYCLYQMQSSAFGSGHESRSQSDLKRVISKLKELKSCGNDGLDGNSTPLSKKQTLSDENTLEENSGKGLTKTPPAQASLSPEIQCDSSIVSPTATPACYGAGHVVSGITDKRKCRSRGILAIGDNNIVFGKGEVLGGFDFGDCNSGNVNRVNTDFDVSMVPMPTQASMHWHLSPKGSNRNDECFENDSCRLQSPADSTISCSPGLLGSQESLKPFDKMVSPFSLDSLSSGNVIRTPQSDSSTDRFVSFSWLSRDYNKKQPFDYEFNIPIEGIKMTSLSPPNSHASSIGRPSDSSFNFESLTTSFNSIDLTQFQRAVNDKASWNSSCTMENISQSQMKISWREEDSDSVSRIHEMNESDCCRFLSDEEDGLKSVGEEEAGINGEGNEKLSPGDPTLICSCAESISTVGESMIASRDSDWSPCKITK